MDPDFPLIQARLSHEDDLVNQRVSWLVNSQSFLLTAYAITFHSYFLPSGWRFCSKGKPRAISRPGSLLLLTNGRSITALPCHKTTSEPHLNWHRIAGRW